MTAWFDLYDWPIDLSVRDDRIHIRQSVQIVRAEIAKLVQQYHLSLQQIMVGGFSQGGAIALITAYHPEYGVREGLGGCINLSGWLPFGNSNHHHHNSGPTTNEYSAMSMAQQQNVPLFWAHGQYDDTVVLEHQPYGIHHLQAAGRLRADQVWAHQYPVGHSSDPNEIIALAEFVDRVLFHNNNNNNNNNHDSDTATTIATNVQNDNEL
jgi:lysophospholipase II